MYQAWQQQNSEYIQDWLQFIEYASRIYGITQELLMKELSNYSWFKTTK